MTTERGKLPPEFEAKIEEIKARHPRGHARAAARAAFEHACELVNAHDGGPVTTVADKWWCPHCQEFVSGNDVTNEERHDPRAGGCDFYVFERQHAVTRAQYLVSRGQR